MPKKNIKYKVFKKDDDGNWVADFQSGSDIEARAHAVMVKGKLYEQTWKLVKDYSKP